jgi:transcriptional antiterminator RfaH
MVVPNLKDEGSAGRSAGWFAVQTLAGQEPKALLNLRRQSYTTCFPAVRRQVRHARRTSWKNQALFPGYVFVQLDLTRDRWYPINSTQGVCRLVSFGSRPAFLPQGLVENLVEATDEAGTIRLADSLARGDKVRVLSGAFADWIGHVAALPDRDRATILLDMLSRKVPVTFERTQLLRLL